mmetsp:Transcript_7407/g.11063  ORF Transcript_7407/g.11063 Transcript_7407/m.11063 type:complete len:576 (-) Transcript_7407:92-1819(-)
MDRDSSSYEPLRVAPKDRCDEIELRNLVHKSPKTDRKMTRDSSEDIEITEVSNERSESIKQSLRLRSESSGRSEKFLTENGRTLDSRGRSVIDVFGTEQNIGQNDWIKGRKLVYLSAACSSMCSILLGYDVGVMSGAKEYIQPDLQLTDIQTAVVVGSLNLVAAVGALIAGRAADTLGRRVAIAIACLVFIIGAGIMTVSPTFSSLLLGRIVTGIGVGMAMMIAPIYIAELAPPDIRGALVSLTDVSINFGILLGYGGSILFDEICEGDSQKWRAMVGAGIIPPALVLICLIIMPESPRWLISKRDPIAGYAVLVRILDDKKLAKENFDSMSDSISHHAREASWKEVLRPQDKAIKAAVTIGLGLGFWQQASGSEAAVYYSPEVLKNSGWEGRKILLGNVAVGLFKLLGEILAFGFLDKIGRRPLFIVSAITSSFCLFGMALAFFTDAGGSVALSMLCAFMFCFSLGMGPVTFVVASEIFPLAIRGKAMSLVVFLNRAMSGIIALSYTSLAYVFTPGGSFFGFALISLVSVWFYYKIVPETKGKTLEQITSELEVSASHSNLRMPQENNLNVRPV